MRKPKRLVGLLLAGLASLLLSAGIGVVQASPAQAANLWPCYIAETNGTCTTITSAPSSGVQVKDRYSGAVITLYNGNSVQVVGWGIDPSYRCGVNNGRFWKIRWEPRPNVLRWAYIGDWYLATGHPSTWQHKFPKLGTGYNGTCDVMKVRPPAA